MSNISEATKKYVDALELIDIDHAHIEDVRNLLYSVVEFSSGAPLNFTEVRSRSGQYQITVCNWDSDFNIEDLFNRFVNRNKREKSFNLFLERVEFNPHVAGIRLSLNFRAPVNPRSRRKRQRYRNGIDQVVGRPLGPPGADGKVEVVTAVYSTEETDTSKVDDRDRAGIQQLLTAVRYFKRTSLKLQIDPVINAEVFYRINVKKFDFWLDTSEVYVRMLHPNLQYRDPVFAMVSQVFVSPQYNSLTILVKREKQITTAEDRHMRMRSSKKEPYDPRYVRASRKMRMY